MYKKIFLWVIVVAIFTTEFLVARNIFFKNSISGDLISKTGGKPNSESPEELILNDFFHGRRNGFFVDIGCAEYKNSNLTYYLEKELGWSGIAVDALPEFAWGYLEYRPKTKFYSFIVTDHSGKIEPFYRLIKETWGSSTNKNWAVGIAKVENDKYEKIYIPTVTLNDLLIKNGVSKIDFLTMDIETGEPAALAGFDIAKFRPQLVCIEVQDLNRHKIVKYFKDHGYKRIDKYLKYFRHDQPNWYFKPNEN